MSDLRRANSETYVEGASCVDRISSGMTEGRSSRRRARWRGEDALRATRDSAQFDEQRGHMDGVCSSAQLPDAFRAAFRRHPAGVAIITADSVGSPVGLTATSVISVSAEPAMLVFSLSGSSSATPAIAAADTVMIHLLSAGELAPAKLFATSNIDRFANTSSWVRAATGEPVLRCEATRIRGKVVSQMAAGGSIVVAVQALGVSIPQEPTGPLVYFDRSWHTLSDASLLP